MRIIKKYANRRLYDTHHSEYVTLEELAATIREGVDVQVVDAKGGDDLTQATLAQIVVESGAAKLLPTSLLHQMIRMGDDSLAEFMQLYVAWAFDVYSEMRKGMGKLPAIGSLASFEEGSTMAKLLSLNPFFRSVKAKHGVEIAPKPPPDPVNDVSDLRAEIDELKALVRGLAQAPAEVGPEEI